jgi:outer membrane protein assembly factor BamB
MSVVRQKFLLSLLLCVACTVGPFLCQRSPQSPDASLLDMRGDSSTLPVGPGHSTAASAVDAALSTAAEASWPMAGANPQRTSWTPEEVRPLAGHSQLYPAWYRPFHPYIDGQVQIIAAHGLLYVSTARGLYALEADTGDLEWVYPTELPLGNSPTITNGVAYVGGFDHRIHAIEADPDPGILPIDDDTGYRLNDRVLWTYEASAGFETNPLVINDTVYAGNRDGAFYALDANTGALRWSYQTGGPILFSAAYQGNTVYFASNDAHAYALDAQTGELVWKSAKLPGGGFYSFWPVVYRDWVIFTGAHHYRKDEPGWEPDIGSENLVTYQELEDLYPDHRTDPDGTPIGTVGTEPGDWVLGTTTVDMSRITEYFEEPTPDEATADPAGLSRNKHKPWRRTFFVLSRSTGREYTFDSDGDGQAEYAPVAWAGSTHSGSKYPPVIGGDGVLYQFNNYKSGEWIAGGQAMGWKFGTQFMSHVSSIWGPVDELHAFSAGGDLIYWEHWGIEQAGIFDISQPNECWMPCTSSREWKCLEYGEIDTLMPGWDEMYNTSINEVYAQIQNGPVPYRNKIFWHVGRVVLAWSPEPDPVVRQPVAQTVTAKDAPPQVTTEQMKQRLAMEVAKIVQAGHLRPGYYVSGMWDGTINMNNPSGDYLNDYFHNPADTIYTLIRALPHLTDRPLLWQQTRAYLQQEFSAYPPYDIAHVGWSDGVPREAFDLPPDIEVQLLDFPARTCSGATIWCIPAEWWNFPQDSFYVLWKYAQEFGGAEYILDQIEDKLESPPSDSFLADYPYFHNAYIAGYIGYLELERMAGRPESTDVRAELNRLLSLRVNTFSKDTPFTEGTDYRRTLSVARNFMYLVPELADYLYEYAGTEVQEAVNEYNEISPYWFVSKYDQTHREGNLHPLYDVPAIFQAKALILRESREELVKYLDVPAFKVGDLFYIQNLIAAIEASYDLEKTATPLFGNQGGAITYTLSFFGTGDTFILTDTLSAGMSAPSNFVLVGTSIVPAYNSEQHRLTWNDSPPADQEVTIRYAVVIITSAHVALVNVAELSKEDDGPSTAQATVVANPYLEKIASPTVGIQGDAVTYTLSFLGTGNTLTLTDALSAGVSAPGNFELKGTSVPPSYDSGRHRLTWSDTPAAGQEVTIRYKVVITTNSRQFLVNVAELTGSGSQPITATATVVSNPVRVYLPLVLKDWGDTRSPAALPTGCGFENLGPARGQASGVY